MLYFNQHIERKTMKINHLFQISAVIAAAWISIPAYGVQMQLVAHRGMWSTNVPPNTVEAIKAAYDAGATWVETDFHHTDAGQMICIHGKDDLLKFAGVTNKTIKGLTPEDIATINLGAVSKLSRPYRIPLLDDVLAIVPKHAVLQAEIKGYSPQYADIFDAARERAGLSITNIVLSSFNYAALKDFKKRYPAYRTILLGGGARPKDGGSSVLYKYIKMAKEAGLDAVCPACKSVDGVRTRAGADAVRAAGLEFKLFAVNSLDNLRVAKTLGASGFTCNHWHRAFDWAKEIGGIELKP